MPASCDWSNASSGPLEGLSEIVIQRGWERIWMIFPVRIAIDNDVFKNNILIADSISLKSDIHMRYHDCLCHGGLVTRDDIPKIHH